MTRIALTGDLSLVRQVMFRRLRDDRNNPQGWRQLDVDTVRGFSNYVEFHPGISQDEGFSMAVIDVFWQLVSEGILAPGLNSMNPALPWFHLTAYGRRVIDQGEYQPHDRDGYLDRLSARNPNIDPTVLAYLEESLDTFRTGNRIASMVMLGVAAERVFDLVCESLLASLASQKEQATLQAHLNRARMKPRIDFVHHKFAALQHAGSPGFPESATLMVTSMYDMIRVQRNDLGHPRETPPRLAQDEANARLQMFAGYFETAEHVRQFLANNQVP